MHPACSNLVVWYVKIAFIALARDPVKPLCRVYVYRTHGRTYRMNL